MVTLESIEWKGPDTIDDILAVGIKPMQHIVNMMDTEILEELDDKPDNLYYLNVTLGQLLDDLKNTIKRIGEECGYGVNYKNKDKECVRPI